MGYSSETIQAFYSFVDSATSEIISLREQKRSEDAFTMRPHFQQLVFTFRENCEKIGIDRSHVEDMAYALVASIDEAALSCGGELSTFWMVSTLQFEYYGENMAGEKFFTKLEDLMKESEKNSLTLYLYYRMMAIGFEGRYYGDNENREKLIENCARALVRIHADRIPEVPEFSDAPAQGNSTFYIPGWIYAVACVVLIVAGWIVNKGFSDATTNEILEQVEQITAPKTTPAAAKGGE